MGPLFFFHCFQVLPLSNLEVAFADTSDAGCDFGMALPHVSPGSQGASSIDVYHVNWKSASQGDYVESSIKFCLRYGPEEAWTLADETVRVVPTFALLVATTPSLVAPGDDVVVNFANTPGMIGLSSDLPLPAVLCSWGFFLVAPRYGRTFVLWHS